MNVYTTTEVARLCKVAPRMVTRWYDSGRLKGYRIPGSQEKRFPREYLLKFLREHGLPTEDVEADPDSTPVPEPVEPQPDPAMISRSLADIEVGRTRSIESVIADVPAAPRTYEDGVRDAVKVVNSRLEEALSECNYDAARAARDILDSLRSLLASEADAGQPKGTGAT